LNIEELAKTLTLDEYGIFRSRRTSYTLAYPLDQNQRCFQIEDNSFWFKHRNDCIISLLKRFPPASMLLDLGGGNGFVARRMIDEGFDVALLEPGPAGAFNGRMARNLPIVICSTLEDVGFPESSLDAVGCFDVIEHIADDYAFVGQVQKILKPGGLFYITVPASSWLWSGHDTHAQHYRRYEKQTILDLLSQNFDVLYFTYFFRILILPTLLMKTIPYRLGISKETSILTFETEHGGKFVKWLNMLNIFFEMEKKNIAMGREQRFGSSCLLVARKKTELA
jgi:SAM-dependent methyltransferase